MKQNLSGKKPFPGVSPGDIKPSIPHIRNSLAKEEGEEEDGEGLRDNRRLPHGSRTPGQN